MRNCKLIQRLPDIYLPGRIHKFIVCIIGLITLGEHQMVTQIVAWPRKLVLRGRIHKLPLNYIWTLVRESTI
jgi:hypothetical protein